MARDFGILEKTEIIALLDLNEGDMADPRKVRKVHEVFRYFEGRPTTRSQILKILRKDRRDDKLDAVWTWVELASERDKRLKEIPPEHFEDEVQKQLEQGFVSKDQLREIKKQIAESRKREEVRVEKEKLKPGDERKLDKLFGELTAEDMQQKIEAYEAIERELDAYE